MIRKLNLAIVLAVAARRHRDRAAGRTRRSPRRSASRCRRRICRSGTVSVRVIAGSDRHRRSSAPTSRSSSTATPRDGAHRLGGPRERSPGLPAGATVQAKVVDEDKKDVASEEFPVPERGGMRVMLTTKPWQGRRRRWRAVRGRRRGGMPEPRQMSGEPRPERADPAGHDHRAASPTTTSRIADKPSTPQRRHRSRSSATTPTTRCRYSTVVKTDATGRASVHRPRSQRRTSYFAMTQLPRNGAVDRLMSTPGDRSTSQAGVRVDAVEREARLDGRRPIDDLAKIEQAATLAETRRPARSGSSLEGVARSDATVTLVDAATGREARRRRKPQAGAARSVERIRATRSSRPTPTCRRARSTSRSTVARARRAEPMPRRRRSAWSRCRREG